MSAVATLEKASAAAQPGTLKVRPAESKADLKAFVDFAWEVYRNDPAWVPPIKSEVHELLSKVNPFWLTAERALFLAERDGRIVGRIAAIENRAHNKFHDDKVGFFGFFECFNDVEASTALLNSASGWLKQRGLTALRGPASPSMGEECGIVIEGLGVEPQIMMAYNPPYYAALLENCGMKKVKDLFAWWMETNLPDSERIGRIVARVKRKHGIKVRTMNVKKFEEELTLVQEIYNEAWERNWGFVPMSAEEVAYTAKKLKPILEPKMVHFVEVEGKVAAMGVTLPDVNQAIKGLNGGSVDLAHPLNVVRFLLGQRKINRCRVFALGIKRSYQKIGLDALLYWEAMEGARKLGWKGGEMSWTLEDNVGINGGIEAMGGKVYKIYRMYERPVA